MIKKKIIETALEGFRGLPPDHWKNLRERIIAALVNAETDEQRLEWVRYHIKQVSQIYYGQGK